MKTKLFISHAYADERIVSLFVDYILVAGSGVKLEDIVYTTREDTGVVNGEDIPSAIKNGIKESRIFVMMVSEPYRKSEVCLNEMGAAWMDNDIMRKIILLPDVGFDRIGWLMHLNKASSVLDSSALDMIHDQVREAMSTSNLTATWNRNKELFIQKVNELGQQPGIVKVEDDEEMDLLDLREQFDYHIESFTKLIAVFTAAIYGYSDKLKSFTQRIQLLSSNPKSMTPMQVRGVMISAAHDTDTVSEVFENNTSNLRFHFDKAIDYATRLQKYDKNQTNRKNNRDSVQVLIDNMINLKDNLTSFRARMDEMVDIDKTFKKSRARLGASVDNFLKVVSFCIARASEYKMS